MPEGDILDDTAGGCSCEELLPARLPKRITDQPVVLWLVSASASVRVG